MLKLRKCRIGVVGLGYVGLPLAVEFGKHFETLGFDVNPQRIAQLRRGRDSTLEVTPAELRAAHRLSFTSELRALRRSQVFIVTVPTPIDGYKRPDLTPLVRASESVGTVLRKGAVVIYESTVYPGCTEEVCVPILERVSGLKFNRDFFAGYSPERINPGDKQHRLTTIRKVTSGSTPQIADFVDQLYGSIVTAGTHKTSSIRVAEAAKVIENTQRDVNIALINELALIFNRLADRHRGGAERRRQQVEFPAVSPGTGRRPLHRRRPLLPHAQGAGDRLPPGDDPRRPAPQRQHGAVRRRADHPADGRAAHPRQGRAGADARHHLQGELPRHPQLQGGRCGARAGEAGRACRHLRPVGERRRLPARVRAAARAGAARRPLRCGGRGGGAPRVPRARGARRARAVSQEARRSTTSSTCFPPARSTAGCEDPGHRRRRLHRLAHRAAPAERGP